MNKNRIRIVVLSIILITIIGGRFSMSFLDINFQQQDIVETETSANAQLMTENMQYTLSNLIDFQIEGAVESSDTPWGFTAGEFDMEDGTHALLLTPGTAASFSVNTEGKQMLSISWMIHPWVSENSDGVGATVEISADGKAENVTKEFLVEAGEDFEKVDIDISELQTEQVRVNITCNGGAAGNEDADWLIIESIEPKDM